MGNSILDNISNEEHNNKNMLGWLEIINKNKLAVFASFAFDNNANVAIFTSMKDQQTLIKQLEHILRILKNSKNIIN